MCEYVSVIGFPPTPPAAVDISGRQFSAVHIKTNPDGCFRCVTIVLLISYDPNAHARMIRVIGSCVEAVLDAVAVQNCAMVAPLPGRHQHGTDVYVPVGLNERQNTNNLRV